MVGRATDASGAVVPEVSITISNLDTNISQKGSTSEVGDFTIPYLNPGRYTLEASAAGFQNYKRGEFTLGVGQTLRLNVPLQIGAASESVTVNDAPPVLNTETATRGEVTTQDEIKEMPLDGRNFTDLAMLSGGVVPRGDGGDGSYAVNGGRADNTGFLLDGMNNTHRRNTGVRRLKRSSRRGLTGRPAFGHGARLRARGRASGFMTCATRQSPRLPRPAPVMQH